ncbi:MAG: 16S rRNA (cytidine(1402)-2'-O)-methyltransferase [Thermodesulfovibrionales bacterium]
MSGALYIVSTPIGNLEDITLRALRVLKEADVIAAEDTRNSRKLLTHYGISRPLISYWGEREKAGAEEAVRRLKQGLSVALVSDAGTPGISDPGSVLIRRAIEEGIRIVPVPGPSALLCALSVSGLDCSEFVFCGFLPPKPAQRQKRLAELVFDTRTLVFYEAPHRVSEMLADILEAFGDRPACVVREITKVHETVLRGGLASIIRDLVAGKIAGEFVVVVSGRQESAAVSVGEALAEVRSLMKKGLSRKDAAKKVASAYGLSRSELYDRSLENG